jgi:hypothetical protein
MNRRHWTFLTTLAPAFVLVLAAQSSAQAQGRSPASGGRSPGLDHAMGRTNEVSLGRGNGGRNVGGPGMPDPSNTSNRTPYEYAKQARIRENNRRQAEKELREHPDMPARLSTTADELREGYHEALFHNLFLTFDQYVAATRLAANLAPTHPNVTHVKILDGLAAHQSIERTLRDLGLGKEEAKEAERRVQREIKESKSRKP